MTHPTPTQAQDQGYEFAHPNIYQIYVLLYHLNETNLLNQNCRISLIQDNNRVRMRAHYYGISETRDLEPDQVLTKTCDKEHLQIKIN